MNFVGRFLLGRHEIFLVGTVLSEFPPGRHRFFLVVTVPSEFPPGRHNLISSPTPRTDPKASHHKKTQPCATSVA